MRLRDRILNFEHWISSDFKLEKPKIFQRELLKLFSEDKNAFFYYRNWLYTLLLNKEEQKSLEEFKKILDLRIGTSKHNNLIKHYSGNEHSEIFSQKRLNTFEIALEMTNSNLNHNTCFLYQQYYEIEILLCVFFSFLELNINEKIEIELANFKDRNGNLKKGVLINNIKSKLENYQLIYNLFETAFNSKIRNTIGHNNYKIINDKIVSLDGKISASNQEVFKSIYSLQTLNNFLLNYFSSKSICNKNLNNSGILGVAFDYDEDLPVLLVCQLSCFYDFGKFDWADKIFFTINNNQLETNIGFQSSMIGTFSKDLENSWFKLLSNNKKLKIYMLSIVPRNNEPEFINLDVGEFVIVEEREPIELEFEIKKTHQ
ncbi:hypothetical protein [Flavobacterium tibetense]|jgi:hypothetical protein|uniref:Uncharacterized protein n=1 Tax=Flavobacterium tibetense TaxID=2233533 RepID=A0A365P1G0_9FLAO|nr:hypothetical protein [Flavobacterium tibetense]RBA28163.1 hypothetical protein DPN68_08390 [Flavobacterium tibetense]